MSDLKEFWDKEEDTFQTLCCAEEYWKTLTTEEQKIYRTLIDGIKYRQGLFFWERGGQKHVNFWQDAKRCKFNFDVLKSRAEYDYECDLGRPKYSWWSQDFLDCLACLGGEKVKELIEELEGKVEK